MIRLQFEFGRPIIIRGDDAFVEVIHVEDIGRDGTRIDAVENRYRITHKSRALQVNKGGGHLANTSSCLTVFSAGGAPTASMTSRGISLTFFKHSLTQRR